MLRQVNDALTGLLLALAGNSVMSDELERIAISIHDGTVPAAWNGYELNPGNSALGTWFKVPCALLAAGVLSKCCWSGATCQGGAAA